MAMTTVFAALALGLLVFLATTTPSHGRIPRRSTLVGSKQVFQQMWSSPTTIKDVRGDLAVNETFVPVIGRRKNFGAIRYSMFMKGIYPGVEYNIINVKVGEKEVDDLSEYESGLRSFGQMASSEDDVVQLTVKPIYPLIPQLERRWPITVNLTEVPIVLSKGMYNTLTVLLSTSLAVSFFLACALLSQVFTFSVVNSRSMMPTIIPKDIILVEKVSPLIQRDVLRGNPSSDEVVFFREPTALAEYIEREKLPPIRKGDLLVKRVRSVQSSQCVEMRGDNPPVSLDSRQFGCISSDYIVGRPIIRVWPLNRVGVLGQLQTQTQTQTQTPRAPQ